jgi:hypothetical protein
MCPRNKCSKLDAECYGPKCETVYINMPSEIFCNEAEPDSPPDNNRIVQLQSQSIFFYLVCETIGTVATPGLLCQPRVIMKMIVESRWNVDWQGKPKFSEKTCAGATSVHHKIPHA